MATPTTFPSISRERQRLHNLPIACWLCLWRCLSVHSVHLCAFVLHVHFWCRDGGGIQRVYLCMLESTYLLSLCRENMCVGRHH